MTRNYNPGTQAAEAGGLEFEDSLHALYIEGGRGEGERRRWGEGRRAEVQKQEERRTCTPKLSASR